MAAFTTESQIGPIQQAVLDLLQIRSATGVELAVAAGIDAGQFHGVQQGLRRRGLIERVEPVYCMYGGTFLYAAIPPPTPEQIAYEARVSAGWEELKSQLDLYVPGRRWSGRS